MIKRSNYSNKKQTTLTSRIGKGILDVADLMPPNRKEQTQTIVIYTYTSSFTYSYMQKFCPPVLKYMTISGAFWEGFRARLKVLRRG